MVTWTHEQRYADIELQTAGVHRTFHWKCRRSEGYTMKFFTKCLLLRIIIFVKFIFESVSCTRTCFCVFVLRKYKYLLCYPYRFRIMELEGNMNLILTFKEYSTYIMLFSTVPISAFLIRLFTKYFQLCLHFCFCREMIIRISPLRLEIVLPQCWFYVWVSLIYNEFNGSTVDSYPFLILQKLSNYSYILNE